MPDNEPVSLDEEAVVLLLPWDHQTIHLKEIMSVKEDSESSFASRSLSRNPLL